MTTHDKQRHSELKKYNATLFQELDRLLKDSRITVNTIHEIEDQLEELEASV